MCKIGEFASDYIEIRRDFLDWAPPTTNGYNVTDSQSTHIYAAGDRHGTVEHGVENHVTHRARNAEKVETEKTTTNSEALPTVQE